MEKGITLHRPACCRTPFRLAFRVCLPWQVARPAARLLQEIGSDVVHIPSQRSSPATTDTVRWPQSRLAASTPPVTPRP